MSGSFEATLEQYPYIDHEPPPDVDPPAFPTPLVPPSLYASFACGIPGASVSAYMNLYAKQLAGHVVVVNGKLILNADAVGHDEDTIDTSGNPESFSGECSCSATLVEYMEVLQLRDTLIGAHELPLKNFDVLQDEVIDGYFGWKVRYFLKIEGECSSSITVNGNTVSASGTADGSTELLYDDLKTTLAATCGLSNGQITFSGSFTDDFTNDHSGSYADTIGGGTATVTGRSFDVSLTSADDSGLSQAFDHASCTGTDMLLRILGELHGVDGSAYPDSKTIAVSDHYDGTNYDAVTNYTASPNVDETVTKSRSDVFATLNGTSIASENIVEAPLYMRAHLADAAENGDDPQDWRLGIMGKAYPVFTISHAETIDVPEPLVPANWTPLENTNVGLSGSNLQITTHGEEGGGTIGFTFKGESHRYLKVRMKSVNKANQPFIIGANGKQWKKTTGAVNTMTDVIFDLCAPYSLHGAVVDPQENRLPLDAITGYPNDGGRLYGLGWTDSLVISGLAKNEVYEIESVTLFRQDHATARFLPEFFPDHGQVPTTEDTGEVTIYARMAFCLDVDGKPAGDAWDTLSTRDADGNTFDLEFPRISGTGGAIFGAKEFIQRLQEIPGITVTPEVSFPDGFHTLDMPACFLFAGSGAWLNHGSGAFTSGLSLDLSLPVTVYAQPVYDELEGYPGMGNGIWTGDDFDLASATNLAFYKALQAAAWGIVLQTNGEPNDGVTVDVFKRETPYTVSGSGVTDSLGEYHTGTPYAKTPDEFTVRCQALGKPYPTFNEDFATRCVHRVSFAHGLRPLRTNAETNPHNYQNRDGELYQTSLDDGNVIVRKAAFTIPTDTTGTTLWDHETQVNTGNNSADPRLIQDGRGRLYLTYRKATNVVYQTSDDDGRTWNESVTLAMASKHPHPVEGDGDIAAIWFDSGHLAGVYKGKGDADFSSPFTFVDDTGTEITVVDDTFGVAFGKDGPGRWVGSWILDGETSVSVWVSTDELRSWTRKV